MSGARFQHFEAKGAVLWVDPEFSQAIASLELLRGGALERILAGQPAPAAGRGATAILALPGRPERVHLRPLRHGGWLAPLWGSRIAGLGRAQRESEVTATLRASGAPVPRPALLLAHRRGLLWTAAIGTVHEEDTVNGAAYLEAATGRSERLAAARAAARAVRRFHDIGGMHADLHIGNLIVRSREHHSEVFIVDLDRGRHAKPPSPRRRMRELMRLYRSLRKRSLLSSGMRLEAAFFAEYVGGDRSLRAALLRNLPRERRRITRHATRWRSS